MDAAGANPSPAEARLLLARAFARAGDAAAARREYEAARASDPSLLDPDLAGLRPDAVRPPPAMDERPEKGVEDEGDHGTPASPIAGVSPERPAVTFADVGGLDGLKRTIRLGIIAPLERPDLFARYRKRVGGGLLLYGPPGCGKTYVARATAGESRVTFFAVGLHDVLDMWMGNSEKNVHELFEAARASAPSILFFDEVDALGGSRRDMLHTHRTVVHAFLAEMDGVRGGNDRVLVIGATNTPWNVDPAFRRPGRFDRAVFVPPPDEKARAEILRIHLAGRPAGRLDLGRVAKRTAGYSGADLREVVERAVEGILEEVLAGKPERPIGPHDLDRAVREVRPTTGTWLETARARAAEAGKAGGYSEVLAYLGPKKRG